MNDKEKVFNKIKKIRINPCFPNGFSALSEMNNVEEVDIRGFKTTYDLLTQLKKIFEVQKRLKRLTIQVGFS